MKLTYWHTRVGQKVLSPNILDYNFFSQSIMSVKRAFFTDSYESAADMASS